MLNTLAHGVELAVELMVSFCEATGDRPHNVFGDDMGARFVRAVAGRWVGHQDGCNFEFRFLLTRGTTRSQGMDGL